MIPLKDDYIVGPKRLICLQPNDQRAMNPNKNDTNSFWVDDTHLNYRSIEHRIGRYMKHLVLIMVGMLVGCGEKDEMEKPESAGGNLGGGSYKPSSQDEMTDESDLNKRGVLMFESTKALAKESESADAQYGLGVMYENGWGTDQNHTKALMWYEKSAKAGHMMAHYRLGLLHEGSEEIKPDPKKSEKWFDWAAAQAQNDLGFFYWYEKGDHNNALLWFNKAAANGNAESQYMIGQITRDGEGLPKDDVTAWAWWIISAANEYWMAKDNMSGSQSQMTPEQIAKAEELVKEMIKKNPKLIKEKD